MFNNVFRKGLVIGILFLFAGASVLQQVKLTVKADITEGLVGYWNFDEGSGTILNDNSDNGYDGTINGATWTTGISEGALSFDGINDYVQFSSPVLNIPSYSVCAWVKASSLPGASAYIVSNGGFTRNSYGFYFSIYARDPAVFEFGAAEQNDVQLQMADYPATTGIWYFLVGTWDGSSEPNHLKLYVNGAPIGTYNVSQPWNTGPANNLRMGAPSSELNYFYNGILDEVCIYDRVLTQNEIQELFSKSTVYVDDDFDSSIPGWGYNHFSSIQDGIDAVDVGGTVFVNSGTYTEQIGPNSEYIRIEKRLNLIGENRATTIINCPGGDTGIWIYSGLTNVNISGFTVQGNNHVAGTGIYVIRYDCSNIIIENCTVHSFMEGISVYGAHNCVIRNCITYDNSRDGGITVPEGDNHKIYDCSSYSNSYGIRMLGGTSCQIYHNNLYDNTVNAYDMGVNTWYEPTLHQGNYYDDYAGVDANVDGIGDTPYNISGGSNQDLYPFIEQDGWLQQLPPNQPPIADANGPYYAQVGNSITFDGSGSTDSDGTIVGYRWDFTNDGTYDTEWLTSATATHSYSSNGTYMVKLQAKDNAGGIDTDTTTARISSDGGSYPTAEANGPYLGYVNNPIIFSSTGSIGGSEGTIESFYWTFGDGTVSGQQNPTHIYASSGTFSVTLKVINNYGNTNTDSTIVTINELAPYQTPPIADAGGPYTGVVGTAITFNGSGSTDADGTIMFYAWNFGDGTAGAGISPTNTYTTAGNYSVLLTVTDNDSLTNSDSTTVSINVSGPPTIVISIDISNIEPIEEENEKTISVNVFCYHQTVSNIHLEILQSSNLTVTLSSPNITLNPGESKILLINIIAPKLQIPKNSQDKVGSETIVLRAVGDGNITSNTEQINIKIIEKGATPGFELILILFAIALIIKGKRKKITK